MSYNVILEIVMIFVNKLFFFLLSIVCVCLYVVIKGCICCLVLFVSNSSDGVKIFIL